MIYYKFKNLREGFIFAKLHMRSFVKSKLSRNGKITMLFTGIHISYPSPEFLTSQICLLMLFAKISEFTVPISLQGVISPFCEGFIFMKFCTCQVS